MIKTKYIFHSLLISIMLFSTACEKGFEELNKNPFKPIQTEIGPLFNSVLQSLQLGWDEQLYLHNETLYKITQQAALSATTFDNASIGREQVWTNYYRSLANVRDIERRIDAYTGDPEAMNNIRAMLKTIVAYKTFRLTDLFGDIPFFDAGRAYEDETLLRPKFDAQSDIYVYLLDELKWVNEHAKKGPAVTESGEDYVQLEGFDVLFNEDMTLWIKFANSLRLRHAMRASGKDMDLASQHIEDILSNNLPLIEKDEDVGLWPRSLAWKNEGVHWSFREHRKLRMGTTIWKLMSSNDDVSGSGIFDSRARIFFATNNEDEWVPFPQNPDENTPASGGGPYQSARDVNFQLKGSGNIYSAFNYYLIRDEDDIPELFMTSAEVNFLKAEALLRGIGVPMNQDQAKIEYIEGVANSILFWHKMVDNCAIWVNKPPALGTNGEYQTINNPRVKFDGEYDPLEQIYAQRWLDAFRQPWEAYALARRTSKTPVEGERVIHYRLPYPASEAENNPDNWSTQVATMGEDSEQVKIWWIPN